MNDAATLPDILYIENDSRSVVLLRYFLKHFCAVESVSNYRDGIERVLEKKYHAVLIDINIEINMNGINAIEIIRQAPGYENIPIVAISVLKLEEDKIKYLQKICSYYIPKPFSQDEIQSLIRKIFTETNIMKTANSLAYS